MEHSNPLVEAEDELHAAPAALLLLRRGAGTRTTWSFREDDAGTRITVGASPSCDFRIIARRTAPIELTLLFTGDGLYAHSARPHLGARVDGVVLGREWVRLGHGARIELGDARIDVVLGEDEADTEDETAESAFFAGNEPPALDEAADEGEWEPVRDSALSVEHSERFESVLSAPAFPAISRQRLAMAAFAFVSGYTLWLVLLDRL